MNAEPSSSHRPAEAPTALEPFTVDIGQDVLDDLRTRLRAARFAADPGNEDETYGLSTAHLRPLVEYWADGFDWRAAEARLNAVNQHRLDVGGTPVPLRARARQGPRTDPAAADARLAVDLPPLAQGHRAHTHQPPGEGATRDCHVSQHRTYVHFLQSGCRFNNRCHAGRD
jgi:hypothetical protein